MNLDEAIELVHEGILEDDQLDAFKDLNPIFQERVAHGELSVEEASILSKKFNVSIKPEIQAFAELIFTSEEQEEVNKAADALNGSEEERKKIITSLQKRIGTKPKRPLYYLDHEINFLPNYTRDAVVDSGSYIDWLVRHFAHEKSLSQWTSNRNPLGRNLDFLKPTLGEDLYNKIQTFNNVLYAPAKHDFDLETEDPRRFSAKEALVSIFAMEKLSKPLLALSKEARDYADHKIHD